MGNDAMQKAALAGLIAILGAVLVFGLFEMGFVPKNIFKEDPAEIAGENIVDSLLPLAEGGDLRSQWLLGILHLTGEDAPQDFAKAAKWFQRAAEQNHPAAQLNLGRIYQLGDGIPRDLVQAYKWMALASKSFPKSEARDQAMSARDIIAQQLNPQDLKRAKDLVAAWQPTDPAK